MTKQQRINYPPPYVMQTAFEAVLEFVGKYAQLEGPQYEPLQYLAGAEFPGDNTAARAGATYKSLAYIGHKLGMDADTRQAWYELAQFVGISQAHAGIIIARLNERDELHAELDALTTQDSHGMPT